jgi:hypothetical protein
MARLEDLSLELLGAGNRRVDQPPIREERSAERASHKNLIVIDATASQDKHKLHGNGSVVWFLGSTGVESTQWRSPSR